MSQLSDARSYAADAIRYAEIGDKGRAFGSTLVAQACLSRETRTVGLRKDWPENFPEIADAAARVAQAWEAVAAMS